jgi:hypothetical protein
VSVVLSHHPGHSLQCHPHQTFDPHPHLQKQVRSNHEIHVIWPNGFLSETHLPRQEEILAPWLVTPHEVVDVGDHLDKEGVIGGTLNQRDL